MELRVEFELWCVGVMLGIVLGVLYFSLNIEEIKKKRIYNKLYKQIDKLKRTVSELVEKEKDK